MTFENKIAVVMVVGIICGILIAYGIQELKELKRLEREERAWR